MATTVLNTPPGFCAPAAAFSGASSFKPVVNSTSVSFSPNRLPVIRCRIYSTGYKRKLPIRQVPKFVTFAAEGETVEVQTETQEKDPVEGVEPGNEVNNTDGAVDADSSSESENTVLEEHSSVVISSLNLYKEALVNNNDSKITEVELFLKSIEDEKIDLQKKVAQLTEELSYEKDRVLRISADFDNFRKRTERERLSLVSNARGEVVENLLPVLDNFERAKTQIKLATEGEEKVSNSYQSIYKQFVEVLGSLGVVPVETVGKPFDPMLHEAIMREDSTEYEDGVVIEEYRKGFQLGERLLRPSMVKVSAGPGPVENGCPEEANENNNDQEDSPDTTTA
ncbi:Co-chaperone GrpE family protein [Striga hermonthica]|uniref:GrpE protein homolog n=1 Tax=Striga hermonthica TaxID=68872 RepID=A0A9N7NUM2_STRHE|nr:Co-chaperone GrpE family protein [Striga hermonthica]